MAALARIKVVFKLHQREYLSEVPLRRAAYRLRAESWVWKALLHRSRASQVRPFMKGEIANVLTTIEALSKRRAWLAIANKSLADLSMADVLRAFSVVEAEVAKLESLSALSKHHRSLRTRGTLRSYLEAVDFPKARRLTTFFHSRLPLPRFIGRRLISDVPIALGSKEVPPVGALRHTTIPELRRKTKEALVGVLDEISAACRTVLDEHDQAMLRLNEVKSEPVNEAVVARVLDYATTGRSQVKFFEWAKRQAVEELASAYVKVINQHHDSIRRTFTITRSREIHRYLTQRLGVDIGAQWAGLFLPIWVTMRPMIACLLILQRHTAWNANSVIDLESTGLSALTPPLEMCSYKGRVGKQTPPVIVDAGDHDAVRALSHLQVRLAFMKRLKWVPDNETRLWLNPMAARDGCARTYIGWGTALSAFCTRYGLPRFSLEQMRVQTLAAESVEVGGLETARRRAAHASIRTTGEYLDHLVLERLNEAVNLEYQRRLEEDIVYLGSGESGAGELRLIYPIGDGTSCEDPKQPPFEDYLLGGFCKAEDCHAGNGCPKRRIYINKQRVEEAVRTSIYYQNNWVRLFNDNHEAFTARHLPSMAFNVGLLGVLERGPYAHVVRATRDRLSREIEHA